MIDEVTLAKWNLMVGKAQPAARSITLPAWLVLRGNSPRRIFARFRIVAGPTHCKVSLK